MATTARSALSLFLRLGGHVELPEDKVFIDPLPGYVENKAAFDCPAKTWSARKILPVCGYF